MLDIYFCKFLQQKQIPNRTSGTEDPPHPGDRERCGRAADAVPLFRSRQGSRRNRSVADEEHRDESHPGFLPFLLELHSRDCKRPDGFDGADGTRRDATLPSTIPLHSRCVYDTVIMEYISQRLRPSGRAEAGVSDALLLSGRLKCSKPPNFRVPSQPTQRRFWELKVFQAAKTSC